MDIPILTSDLVARLVHAEYAVTLSRVGRVRAMQGNPLGAEHHEFGHMLATMMTRHPEPWWNRVIGLATGDENSLDEILGWFRGYGIQPSFDIVPSQCSENLLRALAARGLFQSDFRNVFYGVPEPPEPPAGGSGITIKEVSSDSELFFNIAHDNHFVPAGARELWRQVTRAQFAGSRCYVAFVEGAPAAQAAMFVQDGVASFGFTATLERYRGRGCHAALLRARMRDAARAASHCDLVTVQADPGSASGRNIERAGLRVAYTKAIWRAL